MSSERVPVVAIVDYGLGNLFSVHNACRVAGLEGLITSDPRQILDADAVILPGVGAFADAMNRLRQLALIDVLLGIASGVKPLIGICLGMQLLMEESYEFGRHRGLGVIKGSVNLIPSVDSTKVPHIGWNKLSVPTGNKQAWGKDLLSGLPDDIYMYFVHSYYVCPTSDDVVIAETHYGGLRFCSALGSKNVFAFQCHPERSGPGGLMVFRNLANMLAANNQSKENAHALS